MVCSDDKPVLGAPPWRKRRPNSPRRPWLVSLVISTRLNSPVTTVVFADQLAQLTPTSRQAQRAAIAQALGLDVPAPVRAGEDREPLRDSASRVRTVLCVRSVPYAFVYLSSTATKKAFSSDKERRRSKKVSIKAGMAAEPHLFSGHHGASPTSS